MPDLWPLLERVGIPCLFLGIAVLYFFKRDQRNESRSDVREKACQDRNDKLEAKVDIMRAMYDDSCVQVIGRNAAALDKNADALVTIAAAFRDLSEDTRHERRRREESGQHPTRNNT